MFSISCGLFPEKIIIFLLRNCVNGTLASHNEQKKIFQTQQPAKFQWKVFLLLMITEIDFFLYLARFTRKTLDSNVLAAAQVPQSDREICGNVFTQFSKNEKWKYRWNFEKCLSWAVYAIFSTKIPESSNWTGDIATAGWKSECCWLIATFVVHKLNSMSIVKTLNEKSK